ncbi:MULTISPECIES: response regulator [unclassified Methylobacterium]|uniref:response regulator n=1 Tax=unclassified Methylobacterium TaxID=2615210 RepID=UPI00226A7F3E
MIQELPPASAAVLVVEDDPLLMMAMVDFVEQAGCEAVEAHTVAEAIRMLETRTDIRTVFTDLDMRGSTAGMKLALVIRERWPPIELILTSSQATPKAHEMPERGIYVSKPFDRRRIVAVIRQFAA